MTTNFGPLDILAITFPIFAIITLGYGAVKSQYFPKEGARFLGLFVIQVAIPAMLFKAISEKHISEIFDLEFFGTYAIASLLTFFLVLWLSKRNGHSPSHRAIAAAGSCSSNTAFIGLPIALAYFGEAAIIGVALAFIFENIFMMPVILAFAEDEAGTKKTMSQTLVRSMKTLIKSPLVIAAATGVLFSIFDIGLAAPISKAISMLSFTSGGVALFAIGGFLVGVSTEGMYQKISYIAFFKLAVHPLVVLGILLLLPPFDPILQGTAVLLAAMPMFSIYPIIGQKFGEEKICAAALLFTTICSFFSISAVLWLLNYFNY